MAVPEEQSGVGLVCPGLPDAVDMSGESEERVGLLGHRGGRPGSKNIAGRDRAR